MKEIKGGPPVRGIRAKLHAVSMTHYPNVNVPETGGNESSGTVQNLGAFWNSDRRPQRRDMTVTDNNSGLGDRSSIRRGLNRAAGSTKSAAGSEIAEKITTLRPASRNESTIGRVKRFLVRSSVQAETPWPTMLSFHI